MARDTSPIVKQSRREGVALHPKAHKVLARKSGIPGQHGQGRQGKQSMQSESEMRFVSADCGGVVPADQLGMKAPAKR